MLKPRVRISVLIIADRRTRFLREAFNSVLNQNADPTTFEILVVSRVQDGELRRLVEGSGHRWIETERGPLGAKLAEGLPLCHGQVIAFLEDDDMFSESKVSLLQEKFAAFTDLLYYHNGFDCISEDGEYVEVNFRRGAAKRIARTGGLAIKTTPPELALRELRGFDADFNLSSISVRRDVALDAIELLRRVDSADSALFAFALASSGSVLVDGERLTRYRIHSGNSAAPLPIDWQNEMNRLYEIGLGRVYSSYVEIERWAGDHGLLSVLRYARSTRLHSKLLLDILAPDLRRTQVYEHLIELLRSCSPAPAFVNPRVVLGGLLYLVSPSVAKHSYMVATSLY